MEILLNSVFALYKVGHLVSLLQNWLLCSPSSKSISMQKKETSQKHARKKGNDKDT